MTGPRSYTLDFPALKSGTHGFVDLRVGLRHGAWALTAFGENIFNERMPEDLFGVFNGAVDLARQPNRPRRYGLELRRSFGARRPRIGCSCAGAGGQIGCRPRFVAVERRYECWRRRAEADPAARVPINTFC